jgi:curli biogenesis system outer membrane secretion channel CsgG
MVPILAAIEMRWTGPTSIRLLASAALLAIVAAAAAGCQTTQTTEATGALPIASVDPPDPDGRHAVEVLGQQYRADSSQRPGGAALRAGAARGGTARSSCRRP